MKNGIRFILWGAIIICCGVLVWGLLRFLPDQEPAAEAGPEVRAVRILVCQESQAAQNAWKQICGEFAEDHENLRLEVEFVPEDYLQRELSMQDDENRLPNLLVCDYGILPAYVSMGVARKMDLDILRVVEEQMTLPARNSVLVDGECYGFPLTCDPLVLFYNRSFYEKNGIPLTQNPDEFIHELRTIRSLGNYNIGFAAREPSELCVLYLQLLYGNGGSIHYLDSEIGKTLCQNLGQMRDDGTMPRDIVLWNQDDLMKAFETGIVLNAVANLSCLRGMEDTKLSFGIRELPFPEEHTDLLFGHCIAMVKPDSDTKEALRWLTKKEHVLSFCREAGFLSVYSDDLDNPGETYGLSDDFMQRFRTEAEACPSYGTWFLISDTIGEELADFLSTLYADGAEEAAVLQQKVRDAIMKR